MQWKKRVYEPPPWSFFKNVLGRIIQGAVQRVFANRRVPIPGFDLTENNM